MALYFDGKESDRLCRGDSRQQLGEAQAGSSRALQEPESRINSRMGVTRMVGQGLTLISGPQMGTVKAFSSLVLFASTADHDAWVSEIREDSTTFEDVDMREPTEVVVLHYLKFRPHLNHHNSSASNPQPYV